MATIITKRTVMSLYADPNDVYSHQVRLVLAEKGVNVEIFSENAASPCDALLAINPYGSVPTLIDRELVLYDARIIMEYLDERFPHPPLLPVYPLARAEKRKMMYRVERDWYSLMNNILQGQSADESRAVLKESLELLDPVFRDKIYFLSEEYSLLDCVLAPLLWRLPQLNVEISADKEGLHRYMEKVFLREAFQSSLTEDERQLRAVNQ